MFKATDSSSHVHLNQPGRTAWEGFATGTSAAVAGGVTTLIDMPLNSIPPTTTVANLEEKRAAARSTGVSCDVGFWGGIIPGNEGDLVPLIDAGVKGFKCFLINSGVDEFPHVGEEDLDKACRALAGTNALVMFHAEFESAPHAHDPPAFADKAAYSTFLASRPQTFETDALTLILRLCRRRADHQPHPRDVLPLPRPPRRGHSPERDPVQVLPAHPRREEPQGDRRGCP
jgi:allantoinase